MILSQRHCNGCDIPCCGIDDCSEQIVHCPKCGSEHAETVSLIIACYDCAENESVVTYNTRYGKTVATGPNKYYREDVLPGIEDRENIERDLEPEDDISLGTKGDWKNRIRYNRETGEYESFEADKKEISTVEDLVQSYISEEDENPQDDGPFIVSVDSFQNEYEHYSKNTLIYYEIDDILTDDRDEVITNSDEYIGPDALDSFGEGSDDENVVYVRNFKKEADYEIIREKGSYRETVLGFQENQDYKNARKYFNLDKEGEE